MARKRRYSDESDYGRKLKDPRWQEMRLRVLERAEFTCQSCGEFESTLEVHHGYYAKDREPWDYELNSLFCLCSECHTWAEARRKAAIAAIGTVPPWFLWVVIKVARWLSCLWEERWTMLSEDYGEEDLEDAIQGATGDYSLALTVRFAQTQSMTVIDDESADYAERDREWSARYSLEQGVTPTSTCPRTGNGALGVVDRRRKRAAEEGSDA